MFIAMQTKYPIGILGATGMVGQRYIQLLENHPWFEITWLAASDRSSGKPYGEAAKWRLDTPLARAHCKNDRLACRSGLARRRSFFRRVDADIRARVGAAVRRCWLCRLSNSSAFRMTPNVPLVIPEVNADHLHLIEEQPWRKESGGYIVTNPNCSTIGLVMALKPLRGALRHRADLCDHHAGRFSGAGYPGVASMDILDNVVPFISSEEEKMEAETLKLLGKLEGQSVKPLAAAMTAHCNRVPVMDGHTECVSIKLGKSSQPGRSEDLLAAWAEFQAAGRHESAFCSGAAGAVGFAA